MKIRAGLTGHSDAWLQILRQEGIPGEAVGTRHVDPAEWSVLVVTESLSLSDRKGVEAFLSAGGSVLGFSGHLRGVAGLACRPARLEYLHASGDRRFEDPGIIDLGVDGLIPVEANTLRTQNHEHAMFVGGWGGGHVAALPFDPAEAMFDERAADRNFYFDADRLPSERVSLVAKGEVRFLLHRCLEFLHHVRGLPYVHLWYYPNAAPAVFVFRIDTDGASRAEIDTLYELARADGIPVSWFVDVKSHESWLTHFASLENQEIGIHCYEHRTEKEHRLNQENFRKAKNLLTDAGCNPRGFSAPFGVWNRSIGRVADEMGMEYTSEFSYAYDTLPFLPQTGPGVQPVLQVPIHPICPGSMLRVGYNETRMAEYFGRLMRQKLLRGEPLIFYHHPSHGCSEVIRFLFGAASGTGAAVLSMLGFARWWKSRESDAVQFEFRGDRIELIADGAMSLQDDVAVEITIGTGRYVRTMLSDGAVDLKGFDRWETVRRSLPPENLRRIREADPRAGLGRLYNRILRKFR